MVAAFAAGLLVRRPVGGALAGAGGLALAPGRARLHLVRDRRRFALQFLVAIRPQWTIISVAVGAATGWTRRVDSGASGRR